MTIVRVVDLTGRIGLHFTAVASGHDAHSRVLVVCEHDSLIPLDIGCVRWAERVTRRFQHAEVKSGARWPAAGRGQRPPASSRVEQTR